MRRTRKAQRIGTIGSGALLLGLSALAVFSGCGGGQEETGPTDTELAAKQFRDLLVGDPAGLEGRARNLRIKLEDRSDLFQDGHTGNVKLVSSDVELDDPVGQDDGPQSFKGNANILISTTFTPALAKSLGGKSIESGSSVPVELTLDEGRNLTKVVLGEAEPSRRSSTAGARGVAEEAIRSFLTVKSPPSRFKQYEASQSDAFLDAAPTRTGSPRDDGDTTLVDDVAGTAECPVYALGPLYELLPPEKTTIMSLKVSEAEPVAEAAPGLDQAGFVAEANVQGKYYCPSGLVDASRITRVSPIDLRISLVRLPREDWKIARFSARNSVNGYANQAFGFYSAVSWPVAESIPLIGMNDRSVEPEPWIESGIMNSRLAVSADDQMQAADVVNRWLASKGHPDLAAQACSKLISQRLTEKYGVAGCTKKIVGMEPELSPVLIGADMDINGRRAMDDSLDARYVLVREDGEWKLDSDAG